jgi:hypothetical protein
MNICPEERMKRRKILHTKCIKTKTLKKKLDKLVVGKYKMQYFHTFKEQK